MSDARSELRAAARVLLIVVAVVVCVAAVAGLSGLVNASIEPKGPSSSDGTAPPPETVIGEPTGSEAAPATAKVPVTRMLDDLGAYLKNYGGMGEYQVVKGAGGKAPTTSSFPGRLSPEARYIAESGEQQPPVYAEVTVERTGGGKLAVLLVYDKRSDGTVGWSDLLTATLP